MSGRTTTAPWKIFAATDKSCSMWRASQFGVNLPAGQIKAELAAIEIGATAGLAKG
jgi:hypothetical protein